MPSLTRAPTTRPKYSGSNAEQYFHDAITFLFYIKGIEYQSINTDFIIPVAEEFIGYTAFVNMQVVKSARKAHAMPPAKYTELLSEHQESSSALLEFLQWLTGCHTHTLRNQVLVCVCVATQALATYAFVKSLAVHVLVAKDKKEIARAANSLLETPEFFTSVCAPFRWFLVQKLSTVSELKDELIARLHRCISGLKIKKISGSETQMGIAISKSFFTACPVEDFCAAFQGPIDEFLAELIPPPSPRKTASPTGVSPKEGGIAFPTVDHGK
jgi:hypothetical protein